MGPLLLEAVVLAASFGLYAGLYGLMLLATRPHGVEPAPAGQDLGPEPPAVVSLLANGWDLTEDAVESTLLDLGARKFYEFRQPANDPTQTTIHVTATPAGQLTGLRPYERSVYDRVTGLADNGLVPLTALTFRDDKQAASWWKTVKATIIADARERGLSQRRFSPAVVTALTVTAVIAALGIAYAVYHYARRDPSPSTDDDPLGTGLSVGFFAFVVLGAIGGRNVGERDTAQGREVAAHWLGVKQWMRGNDGFSDLPPASVAVWDRYLGYGAALGTTRVASAVIDMGMGNRRRVWSSAGGVWHRVKVSYPRFWPRYGQPWGKLVFRAVLAASIGAVLIRFWRQGLSQLSTVDFIHGTWYDRVTALIGPAGYLLGFVLLTYGAYVIVRVVIDAAAPKQVTGQVLWVRVWRSNNGSENSASVPWLYYCAIDDGADDHTKAWGLPATLERRCDTGDTVTATIRRWSRRIDELELQQRGAAGHTSGAVALPEPPAAVAAAVRAGGLFAGILTPPTVSGATLLTPEEVSRALGMKVTIRTPTTGPVAMIVFTTDPGKKAVLMVSVMQGNLVEMMWRRSHGKGTPLTGVGDEAWADGPRCAARSGNTFVGLVLQGPAKSSTSALPELLGQAVARLPKQATPVD